MLKSSTPKEAQYSQKKDASGSFVTSFKDKNNNLFASTKQITGRDLDEVLTRYQTTLKPMHEQFIEPMKEYADIIIPNNKYNTVAVDIVRTIIHNRL